MAALPLIVFDVNETLLDLETMEPTFERIFGDKSAMRLWFADLTLMSSKSLERGPPGSASSPATHGTLSGPSRRAGRQR